MCRRPPQGGVRDPGSHRAVTRWNQGSHSVGGHQVCGLVAAWGQVPRPRLLALSALGVRGLGEAGLRGPLPGKELASGGRKTLADLSARTTKGHDGWKVEIRDAGISDAPDTAQVSPWAFPTSALPPQASCWWAASLPLSVCPPSPAPAPVPCTALGTPQAPNKCHPPTGA